MSLTALLMALGDCPVPLDTLIGIFSALLELREHSCRVLSVCTTLEGSGVWRWAAAAG